MKKFIKKLLRPIWARAWARIQPLEARIQSLEASVRVLSSLEAEHADTLFRRMYAAELETNHVPVLARMFNDLSHQLSTVDLESKRRFAALDDGLREHLPSLLALVWRITALAHELASLADRLEANAPSERGAIAALSKRLSDQVFRLSQAAMETDSHLNELWKSGHSSERDLSPRARKIFSQLQSAIGPRARN